MSIEKMLVSGATRATGADVARIFTRKNSKTSLLLIIIVVLASNVYGWLFLFRKRSV